MARLITVNRDTMQEILKQRSQDQVKDSVWEIFNEFMAQDKAQKDKDYARKMVDQVIEETQELV